MAQILPIETLAAPSITRRRGDQAFDALAPYLQSGPVELTLDDVDIVSASFLDQLVYRLHEVNKGGEVTFVTDNPDVVGKLARIAGARSLVVFIRPRNGERHPVTKYATPALRPIEENDKVKVF